MSEPVDRFYECSRLKLHYVVWGDESKPPLIMVHGSHDHARSWDFVAQELLDRFCVYAVDLRGHGDSDWAPGGGYLFVDMVADLATLVEELNRGPVYLVGHSLGGRVVIDYASTFPERVAGLVVIEGFGHFQRRGTPIERQRRYVEGVWELDEKQPRPYKTLAEAEARMQEANRRLTPDLVRHLTKHAVRQQPDGSYIWKYDVFVRLWPPQEWNIEDTRSLWENVKAPSLHLFGADSWGRRSSPEMLELARAVPGVRLETVQDAGHWVHHDQKDRFVQLVRDFLES